MDFANFETVISGVGFPIAVSIALFWNNRETVKHYERLLSEYRVTIDQHTKAINDVLATLDRK